MPETDDDFAKVEADIATLMARIRSSSLLDAARNCKEPYDIPPALIPAAYAFFAVLVQAGYGSGDEENWFQFLQEALLEVILKTSGMDLH